MNDEGPAGEFLWLDTVPTKIFFFRGVFNLLGITNVGEERGELQVVDDSDTSFLTALGTKRQDTTETPLEVLLGQFVARVALESGVRDP